MPKIRRSFKSAIIGVSAPAYGRFGKGAAALYVVLPNFRINKERRQFIQNVLKEKAVESSEYLGFAKHFKKTGAPSSDHEPGSLSLRHTRNA